MRNCLTEKTYTLCESPRNICAASEELNRNEVAPVTRTIVVTKTIASITTVPCSSLIAPTGDSEQLNQSVANQSQTLHALGALLGLVMVVLAAVITGWICTCWIVKKKRGINITSDNQAR